MGRRINPKRWNGQVQKKIRNNPHFYAVSCEHRERGLTIYMECSSWDFCKFRASLNGEWLYLRDHDEYGRKLIQKGPQAVIDEIKRQYRMERRIREVHYAFGFFLKDRPRKYVYISNVTAATDNLGWKLSTYKEIKKYWRKRHWRNTNAQTATLGVDYQIESVKEEYDEIDPNRPMLVHIIPYSYLLERPWRC